MRVKIIFAILVAVIVVESTLLAIPYLSNFHLYRAANSRNYSQSVSFPFSVFNVPSSQSVITEAEIAFAPAYPVEYRSIPTIIVQERADGLLRVEYFAQNWPNTSGLLLYNNSAPGWTGGKDVSILFRSSGPPSEVNPQLAPRPNGNVDITVGGVTVLSSYPIAWANLSELYLFGYPGSSFTSGSVQISFYEL